MKTTRYTAALAGKICAEIADGQKSLRTVCKQAGMPSKATVFRWLRDNPEFAKMYGEATEDRTDGYMEEIVEIADNCGATKAAIQKAKLKIYARESYCAKVRPKKYGTKVTQEHTGAGGGPITQRVTVEYVGVGDEDPDSAGV
jgi:hypothetical protein